MIVQAITPRGYCKGVMRAIDIVKKSKNEQGPVYILGMIVHNQYIVDAFTKQNIYTLDHPHKTRLELLDDIDHGTVIITAHGASQQVFEKAQQKGLHIIDASCPDVIKTHDLIKDKLMYGYDILYIGKAGHPEAEGAISIDISRIHLITSQSDIDKVNKNKKYIITNQTTMSLYDVYDLCEHAKTVLPDVTIAKETCTATKIRQEAISHIDADVDIVFIVGDPRSHNTKKLASIAEQNNEVHMIASLQDLDIQWLHHKKKAAVSAGASTPTYLTNQVICFLQQFDDTKPETMTKPRINQHKILDENI